MYITAIVIAVAVAVAVVGVMVYGRRAFVDYFTDVNHKASNAELTDVLLLQQLIPLRLRPPIVNTLRHLSGCTQHRSVISGDSWTGFKVKYKILKWD